MEDHRPVLLFAGNKENVQSHVTLLNIFLLVIGAALLLLPALSFAQTTYINKPGALPSPCFGNTTTPPPPPPPGPTPPPTANPFTTYLWIQAETRTEQKGIVTSASDITDLNRGDYALYKAVNFGAQGARTFVVRLGAPTTNVNNIIEIRLDSPQSTPVARLTPVSTGGWGTLAYQANATYSLIYGVHDVYLTFQGSEAAAIDAFGFMRTTPATGLNPPATKPTTLTLSGLPPLATTETRASITYAKVPPTSPDVIYCRLDNAAPAICPNPFVIGATTPLALGQHTVNYYIDSGYGIDDTKPFMSYTWTIYTPFVVPPPPPPPPGGGGGCASGPITIPQTDPDPAGCTCVNNPPPPPTTPPPSGGSIAPKESDSRVVAWVDPGKTFANQGAGYGYQTWEQKDLRLIPDSGLKDPNTGTLVLSRVPDPANSSTMAFKHVILKGMKYFMNATLPTARSSYFSSWGKTAPRVLHDGTKYWVAFAYYLGSDHLDVMGPRSSMALSSLGHGWEKGVVEKNVQDSRRRIWIEAGKQRFSSFVELNAWLGARCRALWDEIGHPEHAQFSVAEMLELERAHLMPMPEPFDGYVEKPARVSSTCLVAVARNRYSVPCELAGQMVSTRLYPGRVVVVANDSVVAGHERLNAAGQTRYDWQHYIPLLQRKPGALRNGAPFADMPEPLQQLRRALLRHAGGDRVMAQVLAIVPTAGLDAVLVAVELALETGPPSGRVSVEHVVNVLGRLKATPVPESAATTLQVAEPPLADTARYDSLRPQDDAEEIDHA